MAACESVIDHGCGFDTEQPEIKEQLRSREHAGARERHRRPARDEIDEHGTKMTLVAPMHVAEGREAGV